VGVACGGGRGRRRRWVWLAEVRGARRQWWAGLGLHGGKGWAWLE
jgi:hypothetical protein